MKISNTILILFLIAACISIGAVSGYIFAVLMTEKERAVENDFENPGIFSPSIRSGNSISQNGSDETSNPQTGSEVEVDILFPVLTDGTYTDTWCYEPCDCVRVTWPMEVLSFSNEISWPHIRLREGASRLLDPWNGVCEFVFRSGKELQARVCIHCMYKDECSNSISIQLNGGSPVPAGNRKQFNRWSWAFSYKEITVRKGLNRLTLRGREDGFTFDRVIVTGIPLRKSVAGLERQLYDILRTAPPVFQRVPFISETLPPIRSLTAHAFPSGSVVIGRGHRNSLSVFLRLNSSTPVQGTVKAYSLRAGLSEKKKYEVTPESRTKILRWNLNFKALNPRHLVPVFVDVFEKETLVYRSRMDFIHPLNWGFWGPYPDPDGKGLYCFEDIESDMSLFHGLSSVKGVSCRLIKDGSCYNDLGVIDFKKVFQREDLTRSQEKNLVAYAVTCLPSRENPHIGTKYGGDDKLKVWLNGKELLRVDADLPIEQSQQLVGTPLQRGHNFFVFKVPQSKGPWQLLFEPDTSVPAGNADLMRVLPIEKWK